MNSNLKFFLTTAIGLVLVGAGFYYIFWAPHVKSTSPLGIISNPEMADFDGENFDNLVAQYGEMKVGMAQVELDWGDIEKERDVYDWDRLDSEINYFYKKGWKVNLLINVIDGYALGEQPEDFVYVDFYNQVFQERFSEFVLTVMERYGDKIDYLVLGSEIDKFLFNEPDQIDAFNLFYNTVYYRVKTDYPEVKVGTSFSYDHLVQTNNINGWQNNFALEQDFVGFTYYNVDANYNVNNIDRVDLALDQMIVLAGDKKLGLVSVGVSNLKEYSSNNQKQDLFVQKVLEKTVNNSDKIEFINYYTAQDPELEYCLKQADQQIFGQLQSTERCRLAEEGNYCTIDSVSEIEKQKLAQWICSHGLLNKDNIPQSGFYAWGKEMTTLNVNAE